MNLRQSPLRTSHERLGAKLVEFGGWEMPLSYPGGTLFEHLACRNSAVVFDVSHLGTVRLSGKDARAKLQAVFTNDLDRIEPGRAQYTHLLDDADGSVVDDCIIWWLSEDRFDVMPNASNTARVQEALGGGTDVTSERAIIAIQGPTARELVKTFSPDAANVPHFGVSTFMFEGVECVVAGTGYTGEDGIECAVPSEIAGVFWRAVLDAGVLPAGLGARDTLRLEAGLPLHGHELGPGITPLQAGLSWVVAWDKANFRGKAALERERAEGLKRRLRGIVSNTRRPLRAEDSCLAGGAVVGTVTSGNYSPILERGIGLALLNASIGDGSSIMVDTRGSQTETMTVKPPFFRHSALVKGRAK